MSSIDSISSIEFVTGTAEEPAAESQAAPETGEAHATPLPNRSEAQLLFDRMLDQCNRLNRLRKRLEQVTGWIAPARATRAVFAEGSQAIPTHATTFFDGMNMLADGNDLATDELERSVEDLAALF
jgi:hypothetical protein